MDGNVFARYILGCREGKDGNERRASKHFILAAKAGYTLSLEGFMHGIVTKDEYANTSRAHQQRVDAMKSDDRDKADALH